MTFVLFYKSKLNNKNLLTFPSNYAKTYTLFFLEFQNWRFTKIILRWQTVLGEQALSDVDIGISALSPFVHSAIKLD